MCVLLYLKDMYFLSTNCLPEEDGRVTTSSVFLSNVKAIYERNDASLVLYFHIIGVTFHDILTGE